MDSSPFEMLGFEVMAPGSARTLRFEQLKAPRSNAVLTVALTANQNNNDEAVKDGYTMQLYIKCADTVIYA